MGLRSELPQRVTNAEIKSEESSIIQSKTPHEPEEPEVPANDLLSGQIATPHNYERPVVATQGSTAQMMSPSESEKPMVIAGDPSNVQTEPPRESQKPMGTAKRPSIRRIKANHDPENPMVVADDVIQRRTSNQPTDKELTILNEPVQLPGPLTKSEQLDHIDFSESQSKSHDSISTLRASKIQTSLVSIPRSSITENFSLPQTEAEELGVELSEQDDREIEPGENKNDLANSTDSESTVTAQSIILKDAPSNPPESLTIQKELSADPNTLLLERLEKENRMHVKNTKPSSIQILSGNNEDIGKQSVLSNMQNPENSSRSFTSLRYSKVPPPPMTELEFWGALVKDYKVTAQRLPTLMTKKIRNGVPVPLRGVVWQSIAGARDPDLANQYERLCGEPSPYDGIIAKDLGRSFPGVDMFRDPNGDGQRTLGRVLKCLSLYDDKIGYCQGLAFLVGPLLMHMGDQQAFCVLVRLLENYDMRGCFLPDLSGLHMRIYQFRQLLRQNIPNLSKHLDDLQIEPVYVSQWFLTIFAASCPLPMLFRIYDIMFAEGAVYTIMRVALSLMRRNEQKILAHSEFEDVMQLLLSRSLWDVYHYNADEFVNDFVSLSEIVTYEKLRVLESSFNAQETDLTVYSMNIASKAIQFSGKSWTPPSKTPRSTSPRLTAPGQPNNLIRRSSSKQSIASTSNSIEGSGTDSTISFSTGTTSMSRASSNTDISSILTQSVSLNQAVKTNKDLHSQIEDLLTALSEVQRENAIVATQLQKEREERDDDRIIVQTLLDRLKNIPDLQSPCEILETTQSLSSFKGITEDLSRQHQTQPLINDGISENKMSSLLKTIELRFSPGPKRPSSSLQTKSQLQEDLSRVNEQLVIETSKTQNLSSKISKQEEDIMELREQSKILNLNLRNAELENQKLDRQLKELRKENAKNTRDYGSNSLGLRELRLGRPNSRDPQTSHPKRISSLGTTSYVSHSPKITESQVSANQPQVMRGSKADDGSEKEALIIELVQAKTSEAIAKQEADELRNRLDSLRKLLDAPVGNRTNVKQSISAGISSYFSSAKHESKPSSLSSPPPAPPEPSTPATSAIPAAPAAPVVSQAPLGNSVAAVTGFLGGWGKRAIGNSFGG